MNTPRSLLLTFLVATALLIPFVASAQSSLGKDIVGQINAGGEQAGFDVEATKDPRIIITDIIRYALMLVGTIFVVLVIYAGYLRFTSHGEEERIENSNKTLIAAVIGLFVVLSAYIVTSFVAKRIYNATSGDFKYETENEAPNTQYEIPLNIKVF